MYYPCYKRFYRPDYRVFERFVDADSLFRTPNDYHHAASDALMSRLNALSFDVFKIKEQVHAFSAEVQGMLSWGQWYNGGRKIFDVSPMLAEALHHSDAGDLVLRDVLPAQRETFYVHFGDGQDIHFNHDQVAFEGAYVDLDPIAIRVTLCGRLPMTTPALDQWRERYDLRIPAELFDLSIREAVDRALDIDVEDLQLARLRDPESRRNIDILLQRQIESHPAWKDAVHLLINLLAWLRYYPDDRKDWWPESAPARLVAQAREISDKIKARARSKLWSAGHLMAIRVGDEFASRFPLDRTLKAHWRRGHWRNQAHGPGFSLRKLIWIWPTMVSPAASL